MIKSVCSTIFYQCFNSKKEAKASFSIFGIANAFYAFCSLLKYTR